MRLSGVSASASLPNLPSVPDPTTAVQNGQALFDKAYQSASGGFNSPSDMMAAAASIVSGLPAGQFTTAFKEAVGTGENLLAGVTEGAAIGGPYGAAAGAVIAGLSSVISSIESMTSIPVQSDTRSTSEKWCFPAVPTGAWEGQQGTAQFQTPLLPFCQPNTLFQTRGFVGLDSGQDGGDDPDQGTNQIRNTNFGVGWVSPPMTTQTSAGAAYWLAQAWLYLRRTFVGATDSQKAWGKYVTDNAETAVGTAAFWNAMHLVDSWWGKSPTFWQRSPPLTAGGGILAPDVNPQEPYGYFWTPGKVSWNDWAGEWTLAIGELNTQCALDYSYFFSYTEVGLNEPAEGGGLTEAESVGVYPVGPDTLRLLEVVGAGSGYFSGTQVLYPVACPDTSLVGLFEIAYFVVTGAIFESEGDLIALHYMLGLEYLWTRGLAADQTGAVPSNFPGGGETDAAVAALSEAMTPPYKWTTPHPNFARVIGIIQAKIASAHAAPHISSRGRFSFGASRGVTGRSADATSVAGYHAAPYSEVEEALTDTMRSKIASLSPPSGVSKVALLGAAAAALLWFFL